MKLPEVPIIPTERDMITTFLGYNHNDTVNQYAPNQFYEMKNLSSDAYPAMTIRKQRGIIEELRKANGIYSIDGLAYVDGTELYYGRTKVCDVEDGEKTIIGMGAYMLVFPDNIMYNTHTGEVEDMDFHYTTENPILFTLCDYAGKEYDYYTGGTAPNTSEYTYWLDTSSDPAVLKMWSENTRQWVSVPTSYVKIMECPTVTKGGVKVECHYLEPKNPVNGDLWCDLTDDTLYRCERSGDTLVWQEEAEYEIAHQNFGELLGEYDGLNISGCTKEDFNECMILYGVGRDYIVVSGILEEVYIQGKANQISFDRNVPELDYVCELDNRIWGCSSENHEIYCCKLGDPKNWESYAGLASDSYALTVGSPGDFTGCIAHLGYVLFFKENCMHKIYGTEPANYTMSTTSCRGVQKGSEKSLQILNEMLYYKSPSAVCVFDGSIPSEISDDLGTGSFTNAVAGASGNKYYISMMDAELKYHMLVYDTKKGMWHREDGTKALGFANVDGVLYYIDGDNRLMVVDREKLGTKLLPGMPIMRNGERSTLYPSDTLYPGMNMEGMTEREQIAWYAETNIIGLDMPDKKYISNITLRLSVEKGSCFRVLIQYDSEGDWQCVLDMNAIAKRSHTIPIRVRRCDHFKLRFEGIGEFRLFSYTKTIEQGSEW